MGFMITLKKKGEELYLKFPWKVGIVLFMAFPETTKGENVEDAIKHIASDPFFDLIEIPPYKEEVLKQIVNLAHEEGLDVALALQPEILSKGLDIASLEENKRANALKVLKDMIELAHRVSISSVALCTSKDPGPENREKALSLLRESLKELCKIAANHNIKLILEVFDRDYDRKLLLGPTREAIDVIRDVREEYENIGLLWDLSHAPMLNETPQILKECADILYHIHIGCAKKVDEGFKDTHPGFYVAGAVNGVEEVAELLQVLHEIGYRGAVSFEVKPEEGQSSLEVVNCAKGVLLHAASLAFKRIASLK
ncbi:MAG: sugar phosphate isomerase/epimerase [Thermoprotei archaeon]|nr:MAG: sugar phosphate isomerase/epimerase [Thermoprotei archaeon]